jgi:colanic acid biosynthesis glycosyl transferase WcaI
VLSDSLAAADVHLSCLLPQLEGLIVPSKVYGVLAAGRPTVFIGDPDGDVARVIRNAECGVSVECGDGIALARELRALRADGERLQAMGRRARQVFEERHTLDSASQRWQDLLADLDARALPRTAASQPAAAHFSEIVSSE